MNRIGTILVLVSLLVLYSCSSWKRHKADYRMMDTVSVSAYNNPLTIYRESAPREWKMLHTRVALSFDYARKAAQGEAWLTLQPYYYPSDTLVLDAKSMQIEKLTVGMGDKPLIYTYDSAQLKIQLGRIYTRNEELKLYIKYTALPYQQATGGSAAITDDRGLYFINADRKIKDKPVQIWTQGETEANSHWLPCIDKPNSRTSIRLELKVPSEYTTLSNGKLISSMDDGIQRVDIWDTDEPIQVYAIMFAIGDFRLAKESWKGKEVNYYVEPAYAPYAKTMFQYTPEMIDFFSKVTGVPYPWNKYSQVVVRDYVSGAMENTSASLFGEFMNQDFREYADENHEDVVSHELFHQWFGDYVTAESWSNLTVNESFATYGEYLWRKYKYGVDYADELAYSDLQKYLNYTSYADPVLVRHYYRDKEDMFDRISYQKGGAILHYMHQLMGDSAFYNAMRIYLTENALQSAEATHWRLAVEKATGKDWNWYFDQWYKRGGHPQLDIHYNYDEEKQQLLVEVTQKQEGDPYRLPLESRLIVGKEIKVVQWDLKKRKEQFVYPYEHGVAPVLVPDIAHVLPGTIQENKTYSQLLQQMEYAPDYISQLNVLKQLKLKDLESAVCKSIIDKGLHNSKAAIRLYTLQLIQQVEQQSFRDNYLSDLRYMAAEDGNNRVRGTAISILGQWQDKGQKDFLQKALKDSSYLVAAFALDALHELDDSLGYHMSLQKLNTRPNTTLDKTAWELMATAGKEGDWVYFEEAMGNLASDAFKAHVPHDLVMYMLAVPNEPIFSNGLQMLKKCILFFDHKSQRANAVAQLYVLKNLLSKKKPKSVPYDLSLRIEQLKQLAKELDESEKEEQIKKVYKYIYQ